MTHRPPKILQEWFRLCSPHQRSEDLKGDLQELYEEELVTHGRARANLRYFAQAFSLLRLKLISETISPLRSTTMMLKNYCLISIRNLIKEKSYAFINISGLAIGMACAFIIMTYVRLELSFDTFHEKADQIYRMQHVYSMVGAPIGPKMVETYPGIIDCTRIYTWARERKTIVADEQIFYEDFYLADNNFFQTFTFDFIAGHPETALSGPESLVVTESTADKYFGEKDPLGQVIYVETLNHLPRTPLKVTGVIKDVPYNSQLQFTHLASFDLIENNPDIKIRESWINDWIATYLVMEKGTDPEPIEQEYWDFFEEHAGVQYPDPFRLMPMTEVRHKSGYLRADYIEQGSIDHIYIFSAVAILVLLIACINYMNLATARSIRRSKEVGIRKVMGAFKEQLLVQFLVEAFFIVFAGVIVGVAITWAGLPFIESLSGIRITEGLTNLGEILLWGVAITVVTGMIAGSYPAFFLSSFGPSHILKEIKGTKSSRHIRKGLVVIQLAVSVILIIASLVVIDQMDYISKKDLGFQTEQTLVLEYGRQPLVDEKWNYIRTALMQVSGVREVASTRSIPGDNAAYWQYHFEGDPEEGDGFPGYYVGNNWVDLLELDIIMGRTFDEQIETDKNAFILTEMAWKEAINLYGDDWKNPLGKTIRYSTTNSGDWKIEKTGPVIGIVKDFHSRSLQMPMEALIIQQTKSNHSLLVKFTANEVNEILIALESIWQELGANRPFNYQFLDQQFAAYYSSEKRFSQLLYAFCCLAIFVACLGLYGLASFSAQQRIKEIGVRKVLGASVYQIFTLITSNFIKMIALSMVIAFPIAWIVTNHWLNNFAYRINVSWINFLWAALITSLLSLITISWLSFRASIADPAISLRDE